MLNLNVHEMISSERFFPIIFWNTNTITLMITTFLISRDSFSSDIYEEDNLKIPNKKQLILLRVLRY